MQMIEKSALGEWYCLTHLIWLNTSRKTRNHASKVHYWHTGDSRTEWEKIDSWKISIQIGIACPYTNPNRCETNFSRNLTPQILRFDRLSPIFGVITWIHVSNRQECPYLFQKNRSWKIEWIVKKLKCNCQLCQMRVKMHGESGISTNYQKCHERPPKVPKPMFWNIARDFLPIFFQKPCF